MHDGHLACFRPFKQMFTPTGRLGDPEELAATLIWFVSDASSYVTGITVPVDGGLVMP